LIKGTPSKSWSNDSAWNIKTALDRGKATLESKSETIDYGEASFKGSWATAEIHLNQEDLSLKDFNFFYAKEIKGGAMDDLVDGIFGLARPDK